MSQRVSLLRYLLRSPHLLLIQAITLNILTFIIDLLIGFSIYQEYKSNIAQGLQSSRLFDASNIQSGMLFEVGGLGVVMFVLAITSITIINQPSST